MAKRCFLRRWSCRTRPKRSCPIIIAIVVIVFVVLVSTKYGDGERSFGPSALARTITKMFVLGLVCKIKASYIKKLDVNEVVANEVGQNILSDL